MPRRLTKAPAFPTVTDRIDAYAHLVLSGDILTGPLVKLAAERHVRDRRDARRLGLVWDAGAASHVITFIETLIKLPDTADEHGDAKPFRLELWQAFIVGSLFGWKWLSGHRRFRNAYIEVGKGNGKTPLLAAIGLYGLLMDGQKAPEVYAAAADRDQAMILFRDAVRMAQASPAIASRVRFAGIEHVHNMAYGLGFFRPFSREQSAKSGTRPHMGLIDEVHEHPNADIVNKIRAGAKGNLDAMFPEITNSGTDRTSICFQHHEHSRRILERVLDDDRWFAYVCTLDDGDDPLVDDACWIKVNPNLGVSIQREYLADQVSAAKHIPAETNTVLRLNFCIWTQTYTRAIDMGAWHRCQPRPPAADLLGAPCFGGLDLGQSDDFSAWIRIWTLDDGRVAVLPRFWIPRATLEAYPHRPYAEWERAGLLTITEGPTTDYDAIEATVQDDCRDSGVRVVAYDKRFAEQLAQHLIGAGIDMVDQAQGFQLSEAIRRKNELITASLLCHGADPILTWMAANYVVRTGHHSDMRPDKEHAADKIDGQVALDMALAVWIRQPVTPTPSYEMFFFGGGT